MHISEQRAAALRQFRGRLRDLIRDADKLDEQFVSAFLCHALDRVDLELQASNDDGMG